MKLKLHLSTLKLGFLSILMSVGALQAANVDVVIQNSAFSPSAVTVNVGDTVTWRQLDFLQHTTTSGSAGVPDGVWDSPGLNRGDSFTNTFSTAGMFSYFCRPHPFMVGTVTVQGAPANSPVVNITSPANNAAFTPGASIEIQATATVDGSTISSVEFLAGATSLGTDNSAPYSVTTTTLAVGTHTLTARATAANGQSATSPGVNVTISAAPTSPVVAITAPTNNATLNTTNVTITATATFEGGTVDMIEFFDGTAFLNMVHGQPFTITANLAPGAHVLTAKATANTGASSTSAPVSITISLSGGGTPIDDPYPPIAKTDITVELQTVVDGMIAPLGLAAPGDGRLFVFDQVGLVHVVANETKLETPLLDLRSRLVPLQSNYDERGLLGLAVHPSFAQNGLIYTYSSEPTAGAATFPINPGSGTNDHQNVLAEWKIDAANTNRVDPASRREILRVDQPQFNHNGGAIHFGPDGMLYLAFGDGGAADDQGPGHSPGGNGQDLNKILGKVVRIDVNTRTSGNGQYGIPSDNPYVGRDGLDEIYASGFRNPYTWSFDKLTGELYVADVGQNEIEELDRVFLGGNYGWPIKEGTFYFNPNGDQDGFISATPAVSNVPGDLIDPIAEYDHSEGLAIVGGYFYRGTQFPNLLGRYITGDFGRFDAPVGRLFVLDRSEFRELRLGLDNRPLGHWIKGFGQDQQGELYVFASTNLGPSGTSGKMLKIIPAQNNLSIQSITQSAAGLVISSSGGVGPFLLQESDSLDNVNWPTRAAATQPSVTITNDDSAGFFRIIDTAGMRATPFTVYMTGAAERPNPVNNTNALGTGTLSLESNTLQFDIRYSGLTGPATAAHIHGPASAAEANNVMVNLAPFNGGAFGTNGVLSGSVTLTPEQKAALLSGKTYVNVHTAANGGGEIRGQIAPVVFTASINGESERPNPVDTDAEGSAVFLLVGNKLTFDLNYAGLSGVASAAHIHGPATEDQAIGVMVNLAPFNGGSFGASGTMGGTVTLTPDQLAALVDGLTYANIHTAANTGGEIRGQIRPRSTAIPLSASLSGAAERPTPVDTPGVGSGSFALEGSVLHFNIRYSGLKAVANNAHIHGPATAALAAPVLISLVPFNGGAFGTNGSLAGSVVVTDAQRAAILEGRTYVNIHSVEHGGGEIRGQLLPSVMQTVLLGASERPASVHTPGRGRGTFVLVGNQLSMNLTYSNLSSTANAAHIHGPATVFEAIGVLVNLADLNGGSFGVSGSFSGTVPLTPDQLSSLADGRTYVNIHTESHGGGEVRGQITR